MDFLSVAFGSLLNVALLAAFVAIVVKLFQIHTTLEEIRDTLRNGGSARIPAPLASVAPIAHPMFQQPAQSYQPSVPFTPLSSDQSGEAMLRALDAQMAMEEAARNPEVVEPGN